MGKIIIINSRNDIVSKTTPILTDIFENDDLYFRNVNKVRLIYRTKNKYLINKYLDNKEKFNNYILKTTVGSSIRKIEKVIENEKGKPIDLLEVGFYKIKLNSLIPDYVLLGLDEEYLEFCLSIYRNIIKVGYEKF